MNSEFKKLSTSIQVQIQSFQDMPPVKLIDLARALGVPIKAATLSPGISGEIRPNSDKSGFIIRVNRHDPPKRQRFTVAHELAHYLLHRDHILDGIKDNVLYRSSLSDILEQQANRLAADILMPYSLLCHAKEEAEEKGVGDIILYLSDRFGVSEGAMRIRLG